METMRERFVRRGFGVCAYANAHGIDPSILSRVLSGELTGKNRSKKEDTRRAVVSLKADGVWLGELPWEVHG